MSISHDVIIKKIEEQLNKAKLSKSYSTVREHVQSIKSLCELILEQDNSNSVKTQPGHVVQSPPTLQQAKRLETDDGANGESLFDF